MKPKAPKKDSKPPRAGKRASCAKAKASWDDIVIRINGIDFDKMEFDVRDVVSFTMIVPPMLFID